MRNVLEWIDFTRSDIDGLPDIGVMWWYENSYVTIKDDTVVGWADNSHNLKLSLEHAKGIAAKSFSIGSSPDEVASAQGTPTSIIGDMWWYENSYVQFHGNFVRSYSDNSGILHVRLLSGDRSRMLVRKNLPADCTDIKLRYT